VAVVELYLIIPSVGDPGRSAVVPEGSLMNPVSLIVVFFNDAIFF
jgi:hypothetical protein